jgi:hypothetical protein
MQGNALATCIMEASICGEYEKAPGLVSPAHNIFAHHRLKQFTKMLELVLLTDPDPNTHQGVRICVQIRP